MSALPEVYDDDNMVTVMSTSSDSGDLDSREKKCLISECNELRISRGYCAKHSKEDANRKMEVRLKKRNTIDPSLPAVATLDPFFMKTLFKEQGRLSEDTVVLLVRKACALLREESNVIELEAPVTVFGDIHGQYFDLINELEVGSAATLPRHYDVITHTIFMSRP